MPKKRHLSITEKRDWLAAIFRDVSGDISQADKFKALSEDTKLAQLQAEESKDKEQQDTKRATPDALELFSLLPPPLLTPEQENSDLPPGSV